MDGADLAAAAAAHVVVVAAVIAVGIGGGLGAGAGRAGAGAGTGIAEQVLDLVKRAVVAAGGISASAGTGVAGVAGITGVAAGTAEAVEDTGDAVEAEISAEAVEDAAQIGHFQTAESAGDGIKRAGVGGCVSAARAAYRCGNGKGNGERQHKGNRYRNYLFHGCYLPFKNKTYSSLRQNAQLYVITILQTHPLCQLLFCKKKNFLIKIIDMTMRKIKIYIIYF